MPWHLNKIACTAPPKEPCLIPASTWGNSQPPFPPAAGTLILLGPTGTWASAHRPFPYIHIHKIKIKKIYRVAIFLFPSFPFVFCFILTACRNFIFFPPFRPLLRCFQRSSSPLSGGSNPSGGRCLGGCWFILSDFLGDPDFIRELQTSPAPPQTSLTPLPEQQWT